MAAGTCLSLLAQAVADNIVQPVIPFIEANIKSTDWHFREAAVMSFGSILDGPDPDVLKPLVLQALPILIEMMRDENVMVKDTTAWTLGRICELLITVIQTDVHLHPLVSALVAALDEQPRIVVNACWALNQLSENLALLVATEDGAALPTTPLSPYYEGIVTSLLRITERYVILSLSKFEFDAQLTMTAGPLMRTTSELQLTKRCLPSSPMLLPTGLKLSDRPQSPLWAAWNHWWPCRFVSKLRIVIMEAY